MYRKKLRQAEKIGQIVGRLIKKIEVEKVNKEVLLTTVWKKILTAKLCEHTKPDRIIDRKLYILVDSASWMNELTFMKKDIKINLQKALLEYGVEIDDVFFKLGKQ